MHSVEIKKTANFGVSRPLRNAALCILFVILPFYFVLLGTTECADLQVTHLQNRNLVPLYGGRGEVLEIIFHHDHSYENNFFDVNININFVLPSGKKITIGGFFYDTHIWKARFAPWEKGTWYYTYTFINKDGDLASGKGSFQCVASKSHGFVRQNPSNPFRWVFDDGTPFFPIGFNNGVSDWNEKGTFLGMNWCMDGGFKDDPNAPDSRVNADYYFKTYRAAGFSIFRFSQENFSHSLFEDLDNYYVNEAKYTDELMQRLRELDWRIFYGFFGYKKGIFIDDPDNEDGMAKVMRFLKYAVDRWGAYVDFWELLNEQKATDKWYEITANYIYAIDPYQHSLTTSWERPDLEVIDFNAPHWYQRENELESDAVTASRAKRWKKFDKPVIVGEQGNLQSNWDERSALRMRLRIWSAFFNEISFLFWNTSYAKHGHYMNIYLGPEERSYVKVLDQFKTYMDADIQMMSVTVSNLKKIRAYALVSKDRVGVYLHHYPDHVEKVFGERLTISIPADGNAIWIDPATGDVLEQFTVAAGKKNLIIPTFQIDIALLVVPLDNTGKY